MNGIQYINRQTAQIEVEQVWKEKIIQLLYGESTFGKWLLAPLAKSPVFSSIVGSYQRSAITQKNILPFIEQYKIDSSEFLDQVSSYKSFNDFFIRKLKKEARPISNSNAVIPADGRFLFYENLSDCPYLNIKGSNYTLREMLQDADLADRFKDGSAVLGRLCPTDYHRFHFPIDCIPSAPKLINGYLLSVNPIALKALPQIFYENKRVLTLLESPIFGEVAMIEFGATTVGSIIETFMPHQPVQKGDEKGYFSFGGSALLLLFKKGSIKFCKDLLNQPLEVRCLLGQPLSE